MASAFGFSRYPQQPTPPAEAIGMALMQRQQQAPMMAPMGMGPDTDGDPDQDAREDGAQRMGAPGQMVDPAPMTDGHSLNAINVAVGEALTRLGGGYSTNPNPFKPRDRAVQNLQQLGLSAVEAQLLVRSGGI